MAKLVQALARATTKTAAAPFKQAKEAAMNQMDPRKGIYGLGLGVGPFIRQLVSELNTKSKGSSEAKEATKQSLLDSKAIKKSSQKSADSLSSVSKQLNTISATLKAMQQTNISQLRWMRIVAGEEAFGARQRSKFGAAPVTTALKTKGGGEDGGEFKPSSLFDTLGTVGVMAVAGSLLYANRDKIMGFIEEFLKGAGLPTSKDLAKKAKDELESTAVEYGGIIFDAIKETASALGPKIKDYVSKALGFGGNDNNGNPIEDGKPGSPGNPDKRNAGGLAGGFLGWKAAAAMKGPWWMKAGAAAGGLFLGEEHPDLAIAGAVGYGTVKGAMAARRVNQARQAAAAAQTAEATQAAAAASAKPMPTARPSATLTPEELASAKRVDAIVAARQAALEKEVADNIAKARSGATGPSKVNQADIPAWQRKIPLTLEQAGATTTTRVLPNTMPSATMTEKAVASAEKAVGAMASAGKEAGAVIGKYGNKLIGAAGLLLSLPQIVEDVQRGDYAAASISAASAVGSLVIGGLVSPFITPAGGFAASMAVGMGGEWVANKFRTPAGAAPNPGGSVTPSASPAASTPAAAPTPAGQYTNPVPGATRSRGDFNENRPGHTHKGVDISASPGTPVQAIASGTVWSAGWQNGYGNVVKIKHDDGKMSLYAHLDAVNVRPGQKVKAGDVIGTVGSTGLEGNEQPHLHLEVMDAQGNWINPRTLVAGIPAYTGSPMPGMAPHEQVAMIPGGTGTPSMSLASSAPNSGSSLAQMSNPFGLGASSADLARMGFSPAEIKDLTEMQAGMRDLMNIGGDIASIFGFGTPSNSGGGAPQAAAPGGNAPATPPSAAQSAAADSEKQRLMMMNLARGRAPWAPAGGWT